MSNDELTKHAIRTSADMLELYEKIDDISRVLGVHGERLDDISRVLGVHGERLDDIDERLTAHIAVSEDHFRRTDANFLEIRDLLSRLMASGN